MMEAKSSLEGCKSNSSAFVGSVGLYLRPRLIIHIIYKQLQGIKRPIYVAKDTPMWIFMIMHHSKKTSEFVLSRQSIRPPYISAKKVRHMSSYTFLASKGKFCKLSNWTSNANISALIWQYAPPSPWCQRQKSMLTWLDTEQCRFISLETNKKLSLHDTPLHAVLAHFDLPPCPTWVILSIR